MQRGTHRDMRHRAEMQHGTVKGELYDSDATGDMCALSWSGAAAPSLVLGPRRASAGLATSMCSCVAVWMKFTHAHTYASCLVVVLALEWCYLCPAAPRRFSRIQEEAGVKSKRHKGATDADEDAAAALSKSGGLANILDELLEGDFDPDAYDKRMAAAFDDDYYEVSGGHANVGVGLACIV